MKKFVEFDRDILRQATANVGVIFVATGVIDALFGNGFHADDIMLATGGLVLILLASMRKPK